MKLLINIDEYTFKQIKDYYENHDTVEATYAYIYHGKPIPTNATNGEAFLMEHPDVVANILKAKGNLFDMVQLRHKGDTLPFAEIYLEWWNAPYDAGSEGKNG